MRARTCAIILALGCGSSPGSGDAIARALSKELGVATAVRCDRAGCVATTAAGLVIPIERGADGAWQTAPLVDPAALTPAVTAALAEVGAEQAVDCGRLRLATDGPERCALAGGGVALVTIADDGELDVELALTAEIAAARLAASDDAALTAASEALADGDGADDEVDDDEPLDGGVADAVLRGPGG